MIKKCIICGKGAITGNAVVRKGMAKSKGGTGSKIVRATKRKFHANLQKMRIVLGKHSRLAYVCTKCLKKGKILRAASK